MRPKATTPGFKINVPIGIHLLFHGFLLKSLVIYIYHYLSPSPSLLQSFTDLRIETALKFNKTKVKWENAPLKIHGKSVFRFVYFESWCKIVCTLVQHIYPSISRIYFGCAHCVFAVLLVLIWKTEIYLWVCIRLHQNSDVNATDCVCKLGINCDNTLYYLFSYTCIG